MSSSDGALRDEPSDAAAQDIDVSLEQTFEIDGLVALRSAVAAHADRLGLSSGRTPELVLVAHELASNAVRHGGGRGRVRMWRAGRVVYCEISDAGPGIAKPSSEQYWRPPVDALGGRGLWLAYHLCDHFEVKSGPDGTVAIAGMRID